MKGDQEAGNEALRYLSRSAEIPGDVARECIDLIIKPGYTGLQEVQDGVLAGLLRESNTARAYLAKKLHECKDNAVFENIYAIGDGAAAGIAAVVLDPSAWSTEDAREACERNMFQLYLAKLLEVGDDHNGKAMKSIARLLAADAERLHQYVDTECFDLILRCLDYRNAVEIRSQATLATAKYLEVSGDTGQQMLVQYVATKVARQYNEDLVLAFSAAAAVFPIASSIASALFLIEGFVPSLVPMLEKRAKSERVEVAALELLSAACIDSACREAIKKDCSAWVQHVLETGKNQQSALAGVILAKLQGPSGSNEGSKPPVGDTSKTDDDLVHRLKHMMVEDADGSKQRSIEGLAYASVMPKVKDQLANDKAFMKRFLGTLKDSSPASPIVFGGLTLLDHLTRFLPLLTEEQNRLSQLKAYANASKGTTKVDPLDETPAVTERCKAIIDAGVVPVLAGLSKNLSPNSIAIMFNIMQSISRVKGSRGVIAQQGGVRLLLQNYTVLMGSSAAEIKARRTAAHALAIILISTDPSLLFSGPGAMPLTSAIIPLLSLLKEDPALLTDGPRDLLPTFEALLALTNLASLAFGSPSEFIISKSWTDIENLLLSSNLLVRRASTQLICNLVSCAKGVELFADESPAAARRLHVLIAMADVDDKDTRKAAGGALATLTEFEGAVKDILSLERGMEILMDLCGDDDEELVHRGIVCVKNAISIDGDVGRQALAKAKELNLNERLIAGNLDDRNPEIRQVSKQLYAPRAS